MTEEQSIEKLLRVWKKTDLNAKDFSMIDAHIAKAENICRTNRHWTELLDITRTVKSAIDVYRNK